MHPNLFLKSHWQPKLEPQIFVIMPFNKKFQRRFDDVFRKAIENRDLKFQGQQLKAYKVDEKNTGDCLHTKILDGIAHSALVLADISTIYRKDKTVYRNANVMYEVGLALACRQHNEVIIVKDDKDSAPFDINSITYESIKFRNTEKSINKIRDLVSSRLSEIDYLLDARVQQTSLSITVQEARVLKEAIKMRREKVEESGDTFSIHQLSAGDEFITLDWKPADHAYFDRSGGSKYSQAVPLLLTKGLISTREIKPEESKVVYQWTFFGSELVKKMFS